MQGAEEGGLILHGNAEHGEDGGRRQGLVEDTRGADENDVDMVKGQAGGQEAVRGGGGCAVTGIAKSEGERPWILIRSGRRRKRVATSIAGTSQAGKRVLWTAKGSDAALVASMMVKLPPSAPLAIWRWRRQTAELWRET